MKSPRQPPPASLAGLRRGLVLRANSLVVTVYGDAIAPRAQSVWLGSLIGVAMLFGLSARLVRTSVFRLTADNWFDVTRVGRRSFYGLSPQGVLRVQHADRRIYEFNLPTWDGRWTLLLLDPRMRASMRQQLKRELLWESFGQLSVGMFAHPHANHRSLREILAAAGAEAQVAVLTAQSLERYAQQPLQTLMHDTFKLAKVEQAWLQFIARFAPLDAQVERLGPSDAFYARTLLIHEYRRVLLRDPNLPQALLPEDWPGVRARQLCEHLYSRLLAPSEEFLCANFLTTDGALLATPQAISQRLTRPFGT
ncbi:PaaX family transcriptional regulator C-terminal domain-containing protein [Aquincola sp. MAHUQ-54]|uniref:PaaX family transcriptional regulator C-terminal domain-containing protein n=1 Tax=Aquincola agrisoli TaxID=3119538 RepID=A0AAW9QGQ0_9BURK